MRNLDGYREKYLKRKARLANMMRLMEKEHGWEGVMAAFHLWMKKPYRGGFDYWMKGKP